MTEEQKNKVEELKKNKEYDVFISYKSEERDEAYYVKTRLEADGLTVWMDRFKILGGDYYKDEIIKNIPKCRCFVILLSERAWHSNEVMDECKQAKELFEECGKDGINIIPIAIDETICPNESISEEIDKFFVLNNPIENRNESCQIERRYCRSNADKRAILREISRKIYILKGENPLTEEEIKANRIKYFKKNINDIINDLKSTGKSKNKINRNQSVEETIRNAIKRCGFSTPMPEYQYYEISKSFSLINKWTDLLIQDIIEYWDFEERDLIPDDNDSDKCKKELNEKCYAEQLIEYFATDYNELYKTVWVKYSKFKQIYDSTPNITLGSESYIERAYKDYIDALKSEEFEHPLVKLLKALKVVDAKKYNRVLSFLYYNENPRFFNGDEKSLFVNTSHFGSTYINVNTDVINEYEETNFDIKEIKAPSHMDYVRKYFADELLKSISRANLIDFFENNPMISVDGKTNHMYWYLIEEFIKDSDYEYALLCIQKLQSDLKMPSVKYIIFNDNKSVNKAKKEFNEFARFVIGVMKHYKCTPNYVRYMNTKDEFICQSLIELLFFIAQAYYKMKIEKLEALLSSTPTEIEKY